MTFLSSLQLGPGTLSGALLDRVRAMGGDAAEGPVDPTNGMRAFRIVGSALDSEAVDGLVVHAIGERLVRALAHTRAEHWTERFGAPRLDSNGYRLWVWSEPRWSVERRPDGSGWLVEAKFLGEAVAAGHLTAEYVDRLYASL